MVKQDSTLVKECLSGNRKAWEILVERYSRLIYSIALRRGLGEEDAADVFQTVCVKLLANLEKLKNDQHLIGWMITTAKYECSHLLRQKYRQHTSLSQDTGNSKLENIVAEDELPMDQIIQLQEEDMVRQAVEELGPRCQQLINMLYLSTPPLSYAEVAAQLDVPVGSIGPTRARCLKTLKDKLVKAGF